MGSSGLLQKLNTLTVALWFMWFSSVDKDGEEEIEAKSERMMQFVADQPKTYKTDKTRSERVRLEEIAANPPNLTDTAAVFTLPPNTISAVLRNYGENPCLTVFGNLCTIPKLPGPPWWAHMYR